MLFRSDIDPLADEIKSLLDGHIALRKEIADLGILPAIDISQSISRLFNRLHSREYTVAARSIAQGMTRFLQERQILLLGGVPDAALQKILNNQERLFDTTRQRIDQSCPFDQTIADVSSLASRLVS